jgi:hypothetical protein
VELIQGTHGACRGRYEFLATALFFGRVPPRPAIVSHIAREDLLHLYRDGRPDYKRIADLIKLSKTDLSKISQVAKSSVRFDANIPEPVALRLREIANIANLVAEFFAGDVQKVGLWFEVANPMLGNISPRDMIRIGRYKRLLNFVVDARDAEAATPP